MKRCVDCRETRSLVRPIGIPRTERALGWAGAVLLMLCLSAYPQCSNSMNVVWSNRLGGPDVDEAYAIAETPEGSSSFSGERHRLVTGVATSTL